jgi:hypothetical protein
MRDVVQWTSPAPLWPEAARAGATASRRESLRRPALLRFASDTFMEDLIALLENDPARLAGSVAQYETWRDTVRRAEPVEAVPKFALPLRRLRLAGERKKAASLALSGGSLNATAVLSETQSRGNNSNGQGSRAKTLKLYQPAHQRYYLVAAGLVCARAGLPDKAVNAGRGERASFVVRRLLPASVRDPKTGRFVPFVDPQTNQPRREIALPAFDETWEEYAFVTTPEGDAGWRKVRGEEEETAGALVAGEEQLPLFNLSYTDDEGRRRRRVFAGLVPAGRREAYMTAAHLPRQTSDADANGSQPNPAIGPQTDPRAMRLRLEVAEPWKRLLERADALRMMQYPDKWKPANVVQVPTEDEPMTEAGLAASLKAAREQIQTGSWLVLLDLAAFLEEHLNDVWQAVLNPTPFNVAALGTGTPARTVYETIKTAALAGWRRTALVSSRYPSAKVKANLAEALREIARADVKPSYGELLESATTSYEREHSSGKADPAWPDFLFPLAHTELSDKPGESSNVALGPLPAVSFTPADTELRNSLRRVSAFAALIDAALAPLPADERPVPAQLPAAAQTPFDLRGGYFRLRCVYERPLCGPLDPPLLSEPTREFQLAGYFDPDAPARPLRIALPVDTTPAGLRKFDKNAAFVMSDILCGQVNRVKGLSLGDLVRSVLPWPLHKDLSVPDTGPCKGDDPALQVGMICSLSLPIITICALLMLMIIVNLLDFIFRWVPYFLICFPLPGFKAKE